MEYALQVLTHGDGPHLKETLETFYEWVRPQPTVISIVRDGPGYTYAPNWLGAGGRRFYVGQAWEGWIGFCKAMSALWQSAPAIAEASGAEYVFWLEHDFRFLRPVDLRPLADALDDHPSLAQMSLMRQPVSEAEEEAGGVVALHRTFGTTFEEQEGWLHHDAYYTTNPSLMRAAFMRENPWPDEPRQCEGLYGIALREAGYSFGIAGGGEPWVAHIGERTGHGY